MKNIYVLWTRIFSEIISIIRNKYPLGCFYTIKKKKTNHFLEEVKNDYQKYYEYIIHEKQQEYEYMKVLQGYLEDLIKTNKINNIELKNAKYEQKQILDEMDKIKMELDQIIKK